MKTMTATCCEDCPFASTAVEFGHMAGADYCAADDERQDIPKDNLGNAPYMPAWCPLLDGPVQVGAAR